jgi:transcriptional regulator with XRE-family HTH domain
MSNDFSRSLALLRREKGVSQRAAAKELGISQALLSHYENGVREPGLAFVTRACDYYNVSADFLLGRTLSRDGTTILDADTLFDASETRDNVLHGSVMATLAKKLLVNSISMLFDLLGKTGDKGAIKAASEYLSTAVYKLFRHLYRAPGVNNEEFFSVPARPFDSGAPTADMLCTEAEYVDCLADHAREKNTFPDMSHAALTEGYPGHYQSLLQIVHTTGERINRTLSAHRAGGTK